MPKSMVQVKRSIGKRGREVWEQVQGMRKVMERRKEVEPNQTD
jgi:hypothetical protein